MAYARCYVSLKTTTRAYAVEGWLSKCLRGVRFVLKLVCAHRLATSQVEPTWRLQEKLPSRLSTSGYARLRACSNMPTRRLICPLSFCPFTKVLNNGYNKQLRSSSFWRALDLASLAAETVIVTTTSAGASYCSQTATWRKPLELNTDQPGREKCRDAYAFTWCARK